jgi:hypothetical protein
MRKYKDLNKQERAKIEALFKEHCSYLDMEFFSEDPYIQFPDGTIVYIEGTEE